MSKRITIDPITRLEGHGKIEIFLDDDGKYHYSHTYPPDRPLVEALAMVGGAAGALER